jgi:hypothetical protein
MWTHGTLPVTPASIDERKPELAKPYTGIELADVAAPGEDVVVVAMDEEATRGLMTELFICGSCFCGGTNIALVMEKRRRAIEEADERKREYEGRPI